jgi:hypothetical protein
MECESAWLEIIRIALAANFYDVFRTAVDSLYLARNPALSPVICKDTIKRAGERLDPRKVKAMRALSCSRGALEVIEGRSDGALFREHSVPLRILWDLLRKLHDPTVQEIDDLLRQRYAIGVLTKDEDKKLLKSKMPDGWDQKDVLARYQHAGIEMVPALSETTS